MSILEELENRNNKLYLFIKNQLSEEDSNLEIIENENLKIKNHLLGTFTYICIFEENKHGILFKIQNIEYIFYSILEKNFSNIEDFVEDFKPLWKYFVNNYNNTIKNKIPNSKEIIKPIDDFKYFIEHWKDAETSSA